MFNSKKFKENGYFLCKGFYEKPELEELRRVVNRFHESWKVKNHDFYSERAVNSAYLTGKEHLSQADRELLFQFIASKKLMTCVSNALPKLPAFVNTQLFFNPANQGQNNYWHRDIQYHLSEEEQKEALSGPEVYHFRLALADEPGVELVPRTHTQWDTEEELNVRLEKNGHSNHDDLSSAIKIELEEGELLVFSANMIHRGLYGMQRMALDILFCDSERELLKFVDDDCLPSQELINCLENPEAFVNCKWVRAVS